MKIFLTCGKLRGNVIQKNNTKKIIKQFKYILQFYTCSNCNLFLRAQLYGLGHPRQPSPRATLAEVTFSLFLSKLQPTVCIRIANSSRGARQLAWASCLTSAGRVALASGTTFLHINALARLTGTTLRIYSRNSYQRSEN